MLKVFRILYNMFLSPDRHLARSLKAVLGFLPINLELFKLAFYHRSSQNGQDQPSNNERLEYLGDAMLSSIVAEYLYKKYPYQDEGFLTKMRSKIVKRDTLNEIGDKMGLDVLLKEFNSTRLSKSMLGNAVEALVGAIYLQYGYKKTEKFVVRKILRGYLDIHLLEHFDDNYKSQLLEWCQKQGKEIEYEVVQRYKMDKRDRFKVAVLVDGRTLAIGDDFNKKSAEQLASESALLELGLLSNGNH
jgi:ribonuclease-3